TYLAAGTLHVTGNFTNTYGTTLNVANLTVDGDVLARNYIISVLTVGGDLLIGNDSYSGYVTMNDGSDITGDVTVVDGYLIQADGASISMNELTVNDGETAQLNGTISFPIVFGSGKSKSMPSLTYNTYTANWDGDLEKSLYDYSTLTFDGDITLKN